MGTVGCYGCYQVLPQGATVFWRALLRYSWVGSTCSTLNRRPTCTFCKMRFVFSACWEWWIKGAMVLPDRDLSLHTALYDGSTLGSTLLHL